MAPELLPRFTFVLIAAHPDEGVDIVWKKVMAPTVLLTLLWVLVGGATIYYVNWLYHGHARELAENLTTIQASEAMQDVLWRLQASVLEVAELADGHTQREVAEWETAFDTHLTEAERSTVTPEERTLVTTIRTQFRSTGSASTAAWTGRRPIQSRIAQLHWRPHV